MCDQRNSGMRNMVERGAGMLPSLGGAVDPPAADGRLASCRETHQANQDSAKLTCFPSNNKIQLQRKKVFAYQCRSLP